MKTKQILFAILLAAALVPAAALAHEVYVLPGGVIQHDFGAVSPNPFNALDKPGDLGKFLGIGGIYIAVVLILMMLSGSPTLNRIFSRALSALKKYGPLIARLTLGLSLFSAGAHKALFGPELPLSLFGNPAILGPMLMVMGLLAIFGLFSRVSALATLIIYIYSVFVQHIYMLTYINYPAEALLVFMAGGGLLSLDRLLFKHSFTQWLEKLEKFEKQYGGLILRLGLGIALLWTAVSIKFIHSDLPLDVINDYNLTKYFPFDPLFIVLGAGLVESAIALFYIFGFEIRFNTLFFLTFITLSIIHFGEAVWPHIMLYGLALAIFCQGYDRYTFEMGLLKRKQEPIF